MELNEFEKGRIEGALAFWTYFSHDDQVAVPAVDTVLKLPAGTTTKYLKSKPA